jgi:photosystem II stability/assembly factor-like uncharacterized protein
MSAPQKKMGTAPVNKKRTSPALWFTAAFVIFMVSRDAAYKQTPRPDPFQPAQFLSLDWWRYPLEKNASARLPSLSADLQAVFVLPEANALWAVGKGGMIIHSSDGGRTWEQQKITRPPGPPEQPQQQAPAKGAFLKLPSLLPRAYAGMPEQAPAPSSPPQQPEDVYNRGKNVLPPAAPQSLKVTDKPPPSTSAYPPDPKQSASPEPPLSPPSSPNLPPAPPPSALPEPPSESVDLYGISFVNDQEGWIVGANSVILHTADGGATWSPQTSGGLTNLTAVQFLADGRRGWAVGDQGVILHTSDGGTTWNRQTSGGEVFLKALHFLPDGHRGWVVGGSNTVLYTSDGGTTWIPQPVSPQVYYLASVYFLADGRQGWVVGTDGMIFHTNDGGSTWTRQSSGTQRELRSVQFLADGRQGWTVGYGAPIGDAQDDTGTILHTTDGGTTWVRQFSGTPWQLESVQFLADGRQGWTVGTNGTILHTTDSGKSWVPQTNYLRRASFSSDPGTYRIWPAPWYYVIGLALPLALLVFALRRYEPAVPTEEESVADRLVSDRPLAAGEPDPLEFNAIARGLSRFLRNEKTQPPLTIAITGEWGTGKSSLMNLLKADLERYGFHPVWFNAWHHQQEDQLLAALLEGVRTQGVPPWWHPEGLWFRGRLLVLRGRRHWLLFLLLSFGIVFSAGYFVAHPQPPTEALQQVRQVIETVVGWGKDLLFGEATPKGDSLAPTQSSTGTESRALFPLLGSISALLFALRKGLTAFGVDPASLLASVSGSARIRDLGAQTGFRQNFAAEFRDVTQALHPRSMLILIDDLDRCRPEKVLEVLEAINFLVASGECFVVIGMALERVERCVGLGFKDVAEELVDEQGGSEQQSSSTIGRKKRSEFARQYLEKLINIEVPVPTPTLAQSTRLLTDANPLQSSPGPGFWQHGLALAAAKTLQFWRWAAFALIFGSVFWLGMIFNLSSEQGMGSRTQPGVTAPTPGVAQPRQTEGQIVPSPSEKEQNRSPFDGVFTPGQRDYPPVWLPLIPLSALLAAGVWMALKNLPEVVIKDSPEFAEALKIWLPVITTRRHTPRSIKRFLNRVRYLAMRQRPQEQDETRWDRLRSWVRQTAGFAQAHEPPPRAANTIPESLLVALSALQIGYPEMNGRQSFLQNLNAPRQNEQTGRPGQEHGQGLREALDTHEKQFNNSSAMQTYWDTFVEVSRGIRV